MNEFDKLGLGRMIMISGYLRVRRLLRHFEFELIDGRKVVRYRVRFPKEALKLQYVLATWLEKELDTLKTVVKNRIKDLESKKEDLRNGLSRIRIRRGHFPHGKTLLRDLRNNRRITLPPKYFSTTLE